jgi:hypothetical protein
MAAATTGEYVLTLELIGDGLTPEAAGRALGELAYLDAAPAPAGPGAFAFHCVVTAGSEIEAVTYANARAVTALIAAGVGAPTLQSVDLTVLQDALV